MSSLALLILTVLLSASISSLVLGLSSTTLRKGPIEGASFIVSFPKDGGRDPSLSIPLSQGGPVDSGSLKVSTVPGIIAPYTIAIDIGLDSRTDWSFGGGEFGGFGLQDRFVGNEASLRFVGSAGGNTFSFLLPEGAEMRDASMVIVSPPSPEGLSLTTGSTGSLVTGGPDSFDSADLDGDGQLDIVYHDKASSSLVLISDPFGCPSSSVLETSVMPPVLTRAIGRSPSRAGTVVTSWVDGQTSVRRTAMHVIKNGGDILRVPLGSNLSVDGSGFSVKRLPDGNDTVLFISGLKRSLYTAQVDRNGNVAKMLLMDEIGGFTDPYMADIDGDHDQDIVLMNGPSLSKGAAMLESLASGGPGGYSVMDINTSLRPSGLAAVCDADGDGREELFFTSRTDGELGMVMFDELRGPTTRTIGISARNGSVRSLPDQVYGKGGVYRGGEGLIYVTSEAGVFQLLPGTDPLGNYLERRSESLPACSILAATNEKDGAAVSPMGRNGPTKQDMIWQHQRSAVLKGKGPGATLDIALPSPQTPSPGPVDIRKVMDGERHAGLFTDPSGNILVRMDLSLTGEPYFIKVTSLKVRYDVTFDASSSLDLLPALVRAQRDFDGSFIPLQVIGSSEGSVEVGPVHLLHDAAPMFEPDLPTVLTVDEDSLARTVLSIKEHIKDDRLPPYELEVRVLPSDDLPEGLLFMDRNLNLISHASAFPDLYGEFPFRLSLSDTRSVVISDELNLVVREVQDQPRVREWPSKVLMEEGTTVTVPLAGGDGCFMDPDGDPMSFEWGFVSMTPDNGGDHLTVEVGNGSLSIGASVDGRGCQFNMEVRARDDRTLPHQYAAVMITVEVLDMDSPPSVLGTLGTLELSEDQSLPTRVWLSELFFDPDDDLSSCAFKATSSERRLLAYVGEGIGRPVLYVQPTGELNGQGKVYVEMSSRGRTVADVLHVNVMPINDLPVVVVDSKRDLEGKGWMLTGHVEDPDDTGGLVQFMTSDGRWRDAWGFNVWTFVVDFSELPPEGGYVFVKANDGKADSATVFIKLNRPEVLTPPFDDPNDDGQDDDDDQFNPPNYIAPKDPDGQDGILFLIFGASAGLLALLVTALLLTEAGFVTVLTAMMSAYSKLSRKDILNHEIRGLIRGYIIANPGDHYSSIKRNLDLNNGTLAYHLRVLEQNGLIKSMYDGIYKRYYPSNVNISKLKKNISKQEEIFNIIIDNPGITMEQIGRNIGVSRQVVNYHVKNLIRAGAITYERDDKSARFYSNETNVIPEDT